MNNKPFWICWGISWITHGLFIIFQGVRVGNVDNKFMNFILLMLFIGFVTKNIFAFFFGMKMQVTISSEVENKPDEKLTRIVFLCLYSVAYSMLFWK